MGDLIEIEGKRRMSREEAAEVIRQIADSLARHNDVELRRESTQITVRVPDEVELEVELEVGSEGGELEIEVSW